MPDRRVISNTSPLYYLHQVGCLNLLRQLYGSICIPEAVVIELEAGAAKGLDVPDVRETPWIEVRRPPGETLIPVIADLGAGEAGAIALGVSMPGSLLILDDKLGRQIARLAGVECSGTLGVLLRAKSEGLLPSVSAILERLTSAGMFLSASLKHRVRLLAGESGDRPADNG